MEVCLLKSKDEATLANWFYLHLVACFGKPKWVRVDRGWGIHGIFCVALSELGGNDMPCKCWISAVKQWISGAL